MGNNKKIIIFFIIMGIFFSLTGCEKVFQVKRIDAKTEAESDAESKNAHGEEIPEEAEGEANKEEENLETQAEQLDTPKEEESLSLLEETATETVQEKPTQVEEGKGFINYLLLSNEKKEDRMGTHKEKFIVGQDHFVHLYAAYYSPNKQSVIAEISWKDAREQLVFKEERMELTAVDGKIAIYSMLGLTKRALGQDKLPDAMGDYWVIIEIDGEVISKTNYSIVAE
ncbi:MAG: hypothetical protein ACOYVD_04085 [Bacillota bacterium]